MQGRALWNKIRFFHLSFQCDPVQCQTVHYTTDAAHVQHANDVVDVIAPDRQSCVRGRLDLKQYLLVSVVEINAVHFIARHHNVIDRNLHQIHDVDQ